MKNILLMSLSTFNFIAKTKKVRESFYMEGPDKISYYYQMEPVLRHLLGQLADKGEKLDELIVLATKEACEEVNVFLGDSKDVLTTSAYQYVKELCPAYTNVVKVDLDFANPSAAIIKSVKELRSKYTEGNTNLYLDTHGGKREVQTSLEAILSIVEKEGIKPTDIYTVEYEEDTGIIKHVTDHYDLNAFVAGMNEFINYGRSKSLYDFLIHSESHDEELASIITRISNAIQLCDMAAFDRELAVMNNWLMNREENGSYIDIFAERIKSEYGKLLNPKCGVVEEIKWCIEKDYIQQALTIIESKIPEVLFPKYLFYGPVKNTTKCTTYYNKQRKTFDYTIKEIVESAKKRWEHPENFMYQKWAFKNVIVENGDKSNEYLKFDGRINATVDKLIQGKKIERTYEVKNNKVGIKFVLNNPSKILGEEQEKLEVPVNNIEDSKSNKSQKEQEELRASTYVRVVLKPDALQKKEAFYFFTMLYMSLKDQRNQANHGSAGDDGKRVKYDEMIDALTAFTRLANYLGIK